MIVLSAVALVWLVIVVLIAWWWRRRAPGLAAVSAVAAAILMLALAACDTILSFTPGSFDSPLFVLDQLVLILAIGVQLPAIWRLAAQAAPVQAGLLAAAVTGLATVVALYAYVGLGPSLFDDGPNVQYVAYLAFSAGLAALAVAAWRRAPRERPGLALVGAGALLFFVVGAHNYIAPVDSSTILLIASPVIALGWLLIGLSWFRAASPVAAPTS